MKQEKTKQDQTKTTYAIVDLITMERFETTSRKEYEQIICLRLEKHNWTIFGYEKRAMVKLNGNNEIETATIIGYR